MHKLFAEFEWDTAALDTVDDAILTYQRIVETFKLAFAERGKLGDSDFVNNAQVKNSLTLVAGCLT